MSVYEEIMAAECRMSVTLTNRQREKVKECLAGSAEPSTTYVTRVVASVLAARS